MNINITHGGSFVKADDRIRATEAAEAALSGVKPTDAYAEYRRQMDDRGEIDSLTGPALVWFEAECAANLALTRDWNDTDAAGCTISA